jgi:hypothetical protein
MKKTVIVLAGLAGVCALIYGLMWFTYSRKHVQLKNKAEAQQKVCEAHFDKMWKVIKQHAQITDHYKESFKELYPKLMEGRYGNARGGALMSWIKESNPTLDSKVWTKMMNAIEAQRTAFFRDQEQLLDIKREHDDLRLQPPSKWFIDESDKVTVVVITSAKTKEAYSSGEENDVELFGKK